VWGRESSQKGGEVIEPGVQSGEMRVVGQEVQQVREMRGAGSPVKKEEIGPGVQTREMRVVEQGVQSGGKKIMGLGVQSAERRIMGLGVQSGGMRIMGLGVRRDENCGSRE
jgi:hypothetical protein